MRNVAVKKYRYSIASLILGILGLIAWTIPIIGAPITIIGLILGMKGHKSIRKGLATVGIVLCIIGLFATVANVSIGVYRGARNQLSPSSNRVVFCENIDGNLNVINPSTTLAAGDIYVRLETSSKFDTTKLKITTYKVDGIKESIFDSAEQIVNQDWFVIDVPITFEAPGRYRVLFTRSTDDKKLGEGVITIK